MAKVDRTLLLKRVVQAPSDRFPRVPNLALHTVLGQAFERCETVWDRHYPAKHKIREGHRCVFFKRVNRQGNAVLFHAYSYLAGHTPDQVVFDDIEEQISADPIVNEDGDHKEIVERFAVLVLGEVLVMESARVAGSGPLAIRAIRDLVKRHVMPNCPPLDLEDAPTLEFRRMAEIHGGVASVTARLHTGFVAEPNTFGNAMETIVANAGFGNARVSATIEAPENGELDVDTVEQILTESEAGTGLSGVTIRFRDKTSLGDLNKYREKLPITVNAVRAGIPLVTEIETAIVEYLVGLATPRDDFQLIREDGTFV